MFIGSRISVLENSRKFPLIRKFQGTIVGSLGYGEYAVKMDNVLPRGYANNFYARDINNLTEIISNCIFAHKNNFNLIVLDVGDLEDDL